MTTYVNARESLVTALNSALTSGFPGTKVFYENTTQIDLDKVGVMFVAVAIDFDDSIRMTIDPTATSKTFGEISLTVFAKEGQGTKSALQLFDFTTALLKYGSFGEVTTECPRPGRKISKQGWMSMELAVPFFFYQ